MRPWPLPLGSGNPRQPSVPPSVCPMALPPAPISFMSLPSNLTLWLPSCSLDAAAARAPLGSCPPSCSGWSTETPSNGPQVAVVPTLANVQTYNCRSSSCHQVSIHHAAPPANHTVNHHKSVRCQTKIRSCDRGCHESGSLLRCIGLVYQLIS